MLKKIRSMFKKQVVTGEKRKGFTLVELMVAMSIVILLGGAAFFGYRHVQQMRRITQVNIDMDAISTAALTYESLNVTGQLPVDLNALATGLTKEESIDGDEHKNLIKSNKVSQADATKGQILDPWNRAYVYNQTDRTVSCTPKDADGTTDLATITKSF